jgi:heat shock protein HtpX
VERRPFGRSIGLSARMAVAAALLAGLYLGILAGIVALFVTLPGRWPYWLVAAVAILGWSAFAHYRSAESLLLRSVGASRPTREESLDLHRRLERLAALAGLPPPGAAVVHSDVPNAFAVGLSPGRSVVAVTRGLEETLTDAELDAVLAHELAHIANRDAVVMTAASVPRTLGTLLVGGEGPDLFLYVWLLLWPFGIPLIALGTLITLTISRYREFAADRGSALLTGAPEHLMSALERLSGSERIPEEDLRLAAVEALWIVPTQTRRFRWLMDHPPLEERLAALAEIARDLGKLGR